MTSNASPPANGSTSPSLMAGLRENQSQAWDRLVELYTPLIFHWCRRLGLPQQEMPDVFQEIFRSVAAHVETLRTDRPNDSFRGWLRTVTTSKVNDFFRRQNKQPHGAGGTEAQERLAQLPDPFEERLDDAHNADDEALCELYARAVELIQDQFEPRTWTAFWLVVVEGKTPREVGEQLSLSPSSVRVFKARVLNRLRQQLGEV